MRDNGNIPESLIFCAFLAAMTIATIIAAYFGSGAFLLPLK